MNSLYLCYYVDNLLKFEIEILCCRFCSHVNEHHPKDILGLDEFLKLRKEVVAEKKEEETSTGMGADDPEAPPGVEPPPGDDAPPGGDGLPMPTKVCIIANI